MEDGPLKSLGRAKAHVEPLLIHQGAGVVAPEPHRSTAAGQADALLDLHESVLPLTTCAGPAEPS